MSIYDQMAPPVSSGDFPPKFDFKYPGASISGVVTDLRIIPPRGEMAAAPVMEVQSDADGIVYSVICAPVVLYRELYNQRPQVGQHVTVTFTGHEGQAKIFTLAVAGAPGQPPAQQGPPAAPPAPHQQGPDIGQPPAWGMGQGQTPPQGPPPGQPAWGQPPAQQSGAGAPPQQPAWGAPPQQ